MQDQTPSPSRDFSAEVKRRLNILNALAMGALPFIILAGMFRKSTALLVLAPAILLIIASAWYYVSVVCKCPACKASLGFSKIPSHCQACGVRVRHLPES